MNLLVLNCGSSSLKFTHYWLSHSDKKILASGAANSIGSADGLLIFHDRRKNESSEYAQTFANQLDAFRCIVTLLLKKNFPPPNAFGHRLVHSGPQLNEHCLIDEAVLRQLDEAVPFAPLHLPQALTLVRAVAEQFPKAAQVACFDTVFHRNLPAQARVLPVPRIFGNAGMHRYGFHGLSCESVVEQLNLNQPNRLIVAHLGSGASVTAVKQGQSVETSMGLTPTGGLIMSTRSGDLDPGVMLYLMREHRLDAAMLEVLFTQQSGLLGISGVSGDLRQLRLAASSNDDARLAIQVFCYSVRRQIGLMAVALGGIDAIVFTGGIGENDAQIRQEVCADLAWLGIDLDIYSNLASRRLISGSESAIAVYVLSSNENDRIAQHTYRVIRRADHLGAPGTTVVNSR